ncbi:MAG: ABC transporter substrate-binding protein [Bacteroidales bacterium]|nr:ABC transporter substrate-binding protein [Bacteroidales bacterium]
MGDDVRIGLLVPDKISVAAIQGAELAICEANKKGSLNGKNFRLVIRSMEGPWGTGSKQAVDLIFNEKVWVLLGSHDGRNAHLVEQAATKSIVVMVSAWSADPTLSQAFVPWFYNCVPNDLQQAETLSKEIFDIRKLKSFAVIYDQEYDSGQALSSMLRVLKADNRPVPLQLSYEDYQDSIQGLLDKIIGSKAGCVLLFCSPKVSFRLFTLVRNAKPDIPVFGTLSVLNEDELTESELKCFDEGFQVTSSEWNSQKCRDFIRDYNEKYGIHPGMVAAYAYDGMGLIIEAARRAGSNDRARIQKALSEITFSGITGNISFDARGNRSDNYRLVSIGNGLPRDALKD